MTRHRRDVDEEGLQQAGGIVMLRVFEHSNALENFNDQS